jgi:hypothetical protein
VKAAAALLLLALGGAAADEKAAPQDKATLDTITVEAQRQRADEQRRVRSFVSAIALAPFQEKLTRWQSQTPICPLVGGLPHDHGEFILARISQIAAAAGAPLAPNFCKPNLYIVVTSDADTLVKEWSKREPYLFADPDGTRIRKFLSSSKPVRVWYNAELFNDEGRPIVINWQTGLPITPSSGYQFRWSEMPGLVSVVILVDSRRAADVSFGQMADYLAMAGLAKVRLDANVGDAPTILQLFSSSGKAPPTGLSPWDESFLKALYHTDQTDRLQLSQVKIAVVHDVAP